MTLTLDQTPGVLPHTHACASHGDHFLAANNGKRHVPLRENNTFIAKVQQCPVSQAGASRGVGKATGGKAMDQHRPTHVDFLAVKLFWLEHGDVVLLKLLHDLQHAEPQMSNTVRRLLAARVAKEHRLRADPESYSFVTLVRNCASSSLVTVSALAITGTMLTLPCSFFSITRSSDRRVWPVGGSRKRHTCTRVSSYSAKQRVVFSSSWKKEAQGAQEGENAKGDRMTSNHCAVGGDWRRGVRLVRDAGGPAGTTQTER